MPDLATSLLRSLVDRATAFGGYIRSLDSANAGSDRGFTLALRMYSRFSQLLIRQVQSDWDLSTTDKDRHTAVLSATRKFFAKRGLVR